LGKKRVTIEVRDGIEGKACTGNLCKSKEDPWRPLNDFYYNKRYETFFSSCKDCSKHYQEEWRLKNPFKEMAQWVRKAVNDGKVVSDIDWEKYLENMYKRQKGKCAVTGIKMSFIRKDPLRFSVDRIDNNKGYIKGNIRLVCWGINELRGRRRIEKFDPLIKKLIIQIKGTGSRNPI